MTKHRLPPRDSKGRFRRVRRANPGERAPLSTRLIALYVRKKEYTPTARRMIRDYAVRTSQSARDVATDVRGEVKHLKSWLGD